MKTILKFYDKETATSISNVAMCKFKKQLFTVHNKYKIDYQQKVIVESVANSIYKNGLINWHDRCFKPTYNFNSNYKFTSLQCEISDLSNYMFENKKIITEINKRIRNFDLTCKESDLLLKRLNNEQVLCDVDNINFDILNISELHINNYYYMNDILNYNRVYLGKLINISRDDNNNEYNTILIFDNNGKIIKLYPSSISTVFSIYENI